MTDAPPSNSAPQPDRLTARPDAASLNPATAPADPGDDPVPGDGPAADGFQLRCSEWLSLGLTVSLAGLVASCWPLWSGQHRFPRVPVVDLLLRVPASIDLVLAWGLAAVLLVRLMVELRMIAGRPAGSRSVAAVFRAQRIRARLLLLPLGLLILLDQHRCQPWAWQFLLILGCWSIARRPREVLLSTAVLAIGLYLHSSVSKCDYSFVTSYGRQFVRAILDAVGLDGQRLTDRQLTVMAALLPTGELAAGLTLSCSRTRRLGVGLALIMHALLLLALGPWGLQHRPGVLLWNGFFLFQAVLIFSIWLPRATRECASLAAQIRNAALGHPRLAAAWIAISLWPLTQPWSLCDSWPGWALYASGTPRATIYVAASQTDRLPHELRPFVGAPQPLGSWSYFDADAWSIAEVGAPIYPQARYRLAVARALAARYSLSDGVRVEQRSAANRLTGQRTARTIIGPEQLAADCRQYWLSTTARISD